MTRQKRVAIFGSTGSIGVQALEVISENSGRYSAVFLSCRERIDLLMKQIEAFTPRAVCVGKREDAQRVLNRFPDLIVYVGEDGLREAARLEECEIMLNALVGIAGLAPTLSALESGRSPESFQIALANKETLVTGGRLVMRLSAETGISILPVDSEHSAIFQSLLGNLTEDVHKVILTGSGGPFRGCTAAELKAVTKEQALAHPTWQMGDKITIDSATLMNKAFEVIEAKWLFNLSPEQIQVTIHPQSIIHSLVSYKDGAMIAQLGVPSMKVPIAYAFSHPVRHAEIAPEVNLAEIGTLTFSDPEGPLKQSLDLAMRVLRDTENGLDSSGVYLNGVNEVLVRMFLDEKITFWDILNALQELLFGHTPHKTETLEEILKVDNKARRDAALWMEE